MCISQVDIWCPLCVNNCLGPVWSLLLWLPSVFLAFESESTSWLAGGTLAIMINRMDCQCKTKNECFQMVLFSNTCENREMKENTGSLTKLLEEMQISLLLLPAPPNLTLTCLQGGKYWLRSVICIHQGMSDLRFPISQGSTVSYNSPSIPGPLPLATSFGAQYLVSTETESEKIT